MLIVVDTLRPDHLGCYGAVRPTSPVVDALAETGVRFVNARSPAPWTQPALASIFTSQYPSVHGLRDIGIPFPPSIPTLAGVLQVHGYATAGVVSHSLVAESFGFDRGFEFFDSSEVRGADHVSGEGVTRAALRALDSLEEKGGPFLLFLHYFDPHAGFQRHPEFGFSRESAGRLRGGESSKELRAIFANITREELDFVRAAYDEEVRFTDRSVGKVLEALRARGLYDQTIVAFTSDHGEAFGEHRWIGHTVNLYEELIRVPLVIRMPRDRWAGQRVDVPVSTVGLAPTLLELAGLEVTAESMRSGSFANLLRGDLPAADLAPVFFEADRLVQKHGIVARGFKLVRNRDNGAVELFDLERDPGELVNLASRRPRMVGQLLALLDDHLGTADSALKSGAVELSDEQRARLRALGYGTGE